MQVDKSKNNRSAKVRFTIRWYRAWNIVCEAKRIWRVR
jgi:hypothetical protein